MDVLPDLADADLKELGVSLGERRRLLKAALTLRPQHAPPDASPSEGPESPPMGPPSAERRQLTVVFVDLVGSTALSIRLDPEDLRELIAAYHSRVAESVERLGGFVAKYLGDGVLAISATRWHTRTIAASRSGDDGWRLISPYRLDQLDLHLPKLLRFLLEHLANLSRRKAA
jgi:class 3 adenylate cyclase